MKVDKERYIARQALKEQGMTDAILKHLTPDIVNKLGRNHVSYHYEIAKVEAFKTSDVYQKYLIGAEKRKLSARKAVNTKIARITEEFSNIHIDVVRGWKRREIVNAAINAYNEFQCMRGRYENATAHEGSSQDFIERISVNFIRHNLTDYEVVLQYLESKVGKFQAYQLLRDRLFKCIAAAYPFFANECARQSGNEIIDVKPNDNRDAQ
jgi:hypothetical protein